MTKSDCSLCECIYTPHILGAVGRWWVCAILAQGTPTTFVLRWIGNVAARGLPWPCSVAGRIFLGSPSCRTSWAISMWRTRYGTRRCSTWAIPATPSGFLALFLVVQSWQRLIAVSASVRAEGSQLLWHAARCMLLVWGLTVLLAFIAGRRSSAWWHGSRHSHAEEVRGDTSAGDACWRAARTAAGGFVRGGAQASG